LATSDDKALWSGNEWFAVQHSHARFGSHLDDHHSDLLDRLLVSQAILGNFPIISADPSIVA